MARYCALWLLLVLLAACARQPVLPADVLQQHWHWPLPQQLWLQITTPQQPAQDYLLVLQDENGLLRASLFDPAGIPVARKQLRGGRWYNEGFLPPQASAESWLTAVVQGLTGGPVPAGQPLVLQLDNGSRLQLGPLE